MFNPVIFQALAMAIAAYILPLDVIGSENIYYYDKAQAQFDAWHSQHPDVDVTPLVFGFFVESEPVPPETLDDAIARLLDTMHVADIEADYPAWYEASQAVNELRHVEDLHPTRFEWSR